jgi:hypothetical protein
MHAVGCGGRGKAEVVCQFRPSGAAVLHQQSNHLRIQSSKHKLTNITLIAKICQCSQSIRRIISFMNYDFLKDEQCLVDFIDQFERGTLPKAMWTHGAHLCVGAWYLMTFPEEEAIERVRRGIQHYNECVGTANTADSGYHETLTRFWLKIIVGQVSGLPPAGGRLTAQEKLKVIRGVVEKFGCQRDLFKCYYSFDVVASREARARWVAPDRMDIFRSLGNKSTLRNI